MKWVPLTERIKQDIAEEEWKLAQAEKTTWQLAPSAITPALPITTPTPTPPITMPTPTAGRPLVTRERPGWQPMPITPLPEEPRYVREGAAWQPTQPEMPSVTTTQLQELLAKATEELKPEAKREEVISLPFWERALQVFAAPFVWIDEYIIKPTLSLAATSVGAVPELKRGVGEDYWDWKRRSWEAWKAPGLEINVPWSDEPWRIDIKGVAELAPWLLIPGAGVVGGGAKAARGLAGFAAKFGPVGRVAGYAVEYSPWGIVEKTVGAALRTTAKAMSKGAARISERVGERVFGKIPEPVVSPAVKKLTTFFEETVMPARREFEKALPALRAKQAANIEKIAAQLRRGEITATQYTDLVEKATAVGAIQAKFAVKATQITSEEMDGLLNDIVKASESGFVSRDTTIALRDTLLGVALPEPHHIQAFAQVYGQGFAEVVGEFARLPISTKGKIIDALNMPRAILASGDLSATFRQGLILLLTHPEKAPQAFWKQLRAFASEKLSLEMDDVLRSHSLYQNAVRDGVEFTALRRGAAMVAKEEPFFSNLAQRVPLVRRSERAFTTFLNEMRMGTYEAAYGAMTAQGASAAELKLMGRFINIASGRGVLPANLNRYAPALNTVLFSARYQMSTLQFPRQIGRMLISKNPYMRREGAKALITFVGGGSALLGLLQSTGVGKVEMDPRSVDFGKLKIGETRLDIWRGYVQYARFVAQMLTGERVSAYGNMNKAQRYDIAFRFLQSKASPALGMMVDLLKGENYMGETLFEGTKGVSKVVRDRVLPLAVQDVMDAMEQSGVSGLWTAIPATLGIGVLTYVNDFVRAKEKIARQLGYETWDEIDPLTQRQLQNSNVELQRAAIEFDRQVMGTAWGDWRLAGNAIEDTFNKNIELAVAQYRETKDGYQFREKVNDAFTARRGGYAAREEMPQFEDIVRRLQTQDVAEALVGLGPEQLAIRTYNDALYGNDMYDEFGDYRFDEAEIRREQLRQQLGKELFDYVEQYRGLRYEDLPFEYQELVKARQILRPYWKIQQQVEAIWGKAKTPSAQRRIDSIVTRVRRRMRSTDPEVAYYYDLFYTRR